MSDTMMKLTKWEELEKVNWNIYYVKNAQKKE
jgi:hypothetical protein